jgi:hypothetical protein
MGGLVQVLSTNILRTILIPPTAVGGYFRSFRKNLNNPPTAVGGISRAV